MRQLSGYGTSRHLSPRIRPARLQVRDSVLQPSSPAITIAVPLLLLAAGAAAAIPKTKTTPQRATAECCLDEAAAVRAGRSGRRRFTVGPRVDRPAVGAAKRHSGAALLWRRSVERVCGAGGGAVMC